MAILFALKLEKLQLEAVTTVAGNVSVDKASENALKILELANNEQIPVAKGMGKPLFRELKTAEHVHGKDGLGNTYLPPSKKSLEQKHAVDLIIDKVMENPHEITLVAAGPLTNLATALLKEPGIKKMFKEVVIMGGACEVPGNITPAAEFNICTDPEAAKIVFHSELPITLVSLDVTRKIKNILRPRHLAEIEKAKTPITKFIGKMVKHYMEFSRKFEGLPGCCLHDPLAVAVAADKSLVKTKRVYIDVETKSDINLGKTKTDLRNVNACLKPDLNVNICLKVESKRFLDMFIDALKK